MILSIVEYFAPSLLYFLNFKLVYEICCCCSFFARYGNITKTDKRFSSYVTRVHDSLLKKVLKGEKYLKLYSYHYLINGFAVLVTQQQV